MKNKKLTTYILLVLSVAIWGTIGWKVYSALKDDAPLVSPVSKKNVEKRKDTVSLLLNYRDPFLGDYPKSNVKEEKDHSQPVVIQKANTESTVEVQPDFQYKGIIRLGKNTQAMVHWNGRDLMFGSKDKIGEFTILRIEEDKLTVSRKNKQYELALQ